jgi:hypothetical protein
MSVSVTISGEIIESNTYLSNYFVTLTGDQTIYGNNTFNQALNVKSLNFSSGQINASTLDISSNSLNFIFNKGQINASILDISLNSLNFSSGQINASTLDISSNSLNFIFNTGQINASTLDISSNILTFSGKSGTQNQILTSNGNYPVWKNFETFQDILFGAEIVDPTLTNGIISFGKEFNLEPYVTITQYSNRIVPLCITNVNRSNFEWAAASSNVGKIMWSAGPKILSMN